MKQKVVHIKNRFGGYIITINASGHGFSTGDFVGANESGWVLATNTTPVLAIGMVVGVIDANNFKLQSSGQISVSQTYIAGDGYFLGENGLAIGYTPENVQFLYTAVDMNKIYLNIGDMFIEDEPDSGNLKFTITISPGQSLTLPFGATYAIDAIVDWGDNTVTNISSWNDPNATHVYAGAGTYQISIAGSMKSLLIDNTTPIYQYIVSIDNWGITGLKEITFTDCTALTTIVRDFENGFQNVDDFVSLFYGCTALTTIPQGLFNYAITATSFAGAFENCTGLTGTIPSGLFDYTVSVTNFSTVFKLCTGLTGDAPDIWNQYPGADGTEAFNGDNFDNQAGIPVDWK